MTPKTGKVIMELLFLLSSFLMRYSLLLSIITRMLRLWSMLFIWFLMPKCMVLVWGIRYIEFNWCIVVVQFTSIIVMFFSHLFKFNLFVLIYVGVRLKFSFLETFCNNYVWLLRNSSIYSFIYIDFFIFCHRRGFTLTVLRFPLTFSAVQISSITKLWNTLIIKSYAPFPHILTLNPVRMCTWKLLQ
jgi:hypothetical protein